MIRIFATALFALKIVPLCGPAIMAEAGGKALRANINRGTAVSVVAPSGAGANGRGCADIYRGAMDIPIRHETGSTLAAAAVRDMGALMPTVVRSRIGGQTPGLWIMAFSFNQRLRIEAETGLMCNS